MWTLLFLSGVACATAKVSSKPDPWDDINKSELERTHRRWSKMAKEKLAKDKKEFDIKTEVPYKAICHYGELVDIRGDITKEEAEKKCKEASALPDGLYLYDWYYAGGRVVIKRLLKTWTLKG